MAGQSVRGQDTQEFQQLTRRYVVVMIGSTVVIGASAFLAPDLRLAAWAMYAVAFVGLFGVLGLHADRSRAAWTLVQFDKLASTYRSLALAMSVAAVASLVVGYLGPAPWL